MSKNFELMQQSGKEQALRPAPSRSPAQQFWQRHGKGNGKHLARRTVSISIASGGRSSAACAASVLAASQEPPHVVVFAGIDHGSGCSRICMRAAETLAKNTPSSVCLVEANLRSPALPAMLGTTNHHGLTDALLQEGPIQSFAKPVRGDNLWLLSSGALAVDSANLLNSERLKARFAELRKEFDFVLIDAPPLTRYSDALAFGQLTDGFILVVEANATRREAALRVAENLRAANVRILGAVLNQRTFPIPDSLYHKL